MRRGILTYLSKGRHKNLGDYMQSVAAAQFTGSDARYVDRETLDTYAGEPIKLIMNGWFMSHPSHFPPAKGIKPLFVSFHLTPTVETRFFTPETIAYLKAYEPIGCRSEDVVEMLARHGIRGEFTSCLTLTLGRTYRHADVPRGRITFVDPFFPRPSATAVWGYVVYAWRALPHLLRHFRAIRLLADRFRVYSILPRSRFAFVRWSYAATFHRTYTSLFDEAVLLTADYLSHKLRRRGEFSDDYLMTVARERLRQYQDVPFVVTSLMHCSLPCTAMGTPVWFVYDPAMTTGRFKGNLPFLNALRIGEDGRIVSEGVPLPPDGRIHVDSIPPVRREHVPYAEKLTLLAIRFMEGE